LSSITPQRYRAWLQLLVNGNQNTVRVWGGGIYEADVFYDICDGTHWNHTIDHFHPAEPLYARRTWQYVSCLAGSGRGSLHAFPVLVWQDFMFACGQASLVGFAVQYALNESSQYPAHDSFLDLVEQEAEDNVKRLRHHPCLVILGKLGFSDLGLDVTRFFEAGNNEG
jgi:beta-mannosidase